MTIQTNHVSYIDDFGFVRDIWCNHRSHSIVFLEPPTHQARIVGPTDEFYGGSYIPMDVLKYVMRLQCKTAVMKMTQYAIPHYKRVA